MDFMANWLGLDTPGLALAPCTAASIPFPTLRGAEFLAVDANWVTNYTLPFGRNTFLQGVSATTPPLSFCNVTFTHTHPGQNDRIHTQLWLPMDDSAVPWNGQLVGAGGGGFQTGFQFDFHAAAVATGHAVVSTDGGHASEDQGHPSTWALLSEGNVDLYALQNFASASLADAGAIGRSAAAAFYGCRVRRSYFVGCSTGGRQAMMLAQRHPGLYDGLLSAAPAIYFSEFVLAMLRVQVRMVELGYAPPPCELDEYTRRAAAACDGLDGVEDGLVSEPGACFGAFDPRTIVGDEFECPELGKKWRLSKEGADIAQTAWGGWKETRDDGATSLIWDGLGHQAALTGLSGTAHTTCDYSTGEPRCEPMPFQPSMQWVQYFLYTSPDKPADITKITLAELARLLHKSRQLYNSMIGTADPDLSGLREAGGKVLLWHGLSDPVIPYNQTRRYYESVVASDPKNSDRYIRYFESPGVDHCGMGPAGLFPHKALDSLKDWVETGKAPETLAAQTEPDADGVPMQRALCKYPQVAKYDGKGGVHIAESYTCQ